MIYDLLIQIYSKPHYINTYLYPLLSKNNAGIICPPYFLSFLIAFLNAALNGFANCCLILLGSNKIPSIIHPKPINHQNQNTKTQYHILALNDEYNISLVLPPNFLFNILLNISFQLKLTK